MCGRTVHTSSLLLSTNVVCNLFFRTNSIQKRHAGLLWPALCHPSTSPSFRFRSCARQVHVGRGRRRRRIHLAAHDYSARRHCVVYCSHYSNALAPKLSLTFIFFLKNQINNERLQVRRAYCGCLGQHERGRQCGQREHGAHHPGNYDASCQRLCRGPDRGARRGAHCIQLGCQARAAADANGPQRHCGHASKPGEPASRRQHRHM